MNDLEYIKQFGKIAVSRICRKLHIDYVNLMMGRTSKANEKKVRKALESELAKLYIDKELLKDDPISD